MPYLGATTLADTLADLRSQATMPDSGAGLLSSLHARKGRAAGSGGRPAGPRRRRPPGRTPSREPPAGPSTAGRAATPQVERLRGLGYVPAVLWLVARVADGLAHAHERGILHRDLKPANILFADDGEPLLLDFNLAADTKLRVHASAALVGGTLPYMAPEHLDAFRDGEAAVDARSDVYSLGVILYELLTGRHPFPIRRGAVDDDPAGDDRRPARPGPRRPAGEPGGLAGRRVDRRPLPRPRPRPALPVGPRAPGRPPAPARRPPAAGTPPSPRSASGPASGRGGTPG